MSKKRKENLPEKNCVNLFSEQKLTPNMVNSKCKLVVLVRLYKLVDMVRLYILVIELLLIFIYDKPSEQRSKVQNYLYSHK